MITLTAIHYYILGAFLFGILLRPIWKYIIKPLNTALAELTLNWLFHREHGPWSFQEAVRKIYHTHKEGEIGDSVGGHVRQLKWENKQMRDHLKFGLYYGEWNAGKCNVKGPNFYSRVDELEHHVKELQEKVKALEEAKQSQDA